MESQKEIITGFNNELKKCKTKEEFKEKRKQIIDSINLMIELKKLEQNNINVSFSK